MTTAKSTTNLEQAATATAEAAGLQKQDIADELLSRLKDKTLLHSAGLIGGKWLAASNGATFQVKNPATGKSIATLPLMKAAETKAAIAAAHSMFDPWRKITAKERGAVLRRWHDEILRHADDIATIMTMECGKPLAEARAEIISGAASAEWFAEEGRRVCGDVLETVARDRRMVTMKQAVGVVAAITPWNFPMSMITRKVAPALAAGCTVVLKPSELTPLTAVALAELLERAGAPDGVLNLVMGDAASIGQELVNNESVRKIGFTGSTAVGKMLMAGAAQTVKRVSLELGGNAPFIVFEDADLELAAKGVVLSALRNAGQTCICANRVFVHESVYKRFSEIVTDLVSKLKVGDGLDASTTTGPLISQAGLDKVVAHVQDAVGKGAQVLTGGRKPQLPAPYDAGTFFEPTVLANASIDMRCFSEETFGPLIPLFKFSSDDEVVMMANSTEYGLAAYFYTRDLARAWRVAEELEYGMVGVNEVAITSEVAPFGGVKQSGVGREQSKYGLDEFMEIKYVCMGLGYSSSS
eukprot:CAMPEP_0202920768 /NCGR_PEP_ID=MMETSP1392-20130828/77027_1 /ASSEMBLY_ACC=CAM_ASM_000868 /TAXON_ID=225041 /ORGANISM="Chlamydomonas chlamydogama, Strain SAG 11-48b" /LENGTH=526 /DNA_ID=CAMNT_0049614281 /DNA_START=54 /DNA_END=1634 /DNA_ORIENTATION=-